MADGQTYFFDLAAGLKPEDVVMQPWAKALQQAPRRMTSTARTIHKRNACSPHGVPRDQRGANGLFPFKIIQTPGLVVILYEQLNLFRQVFMDGRKLPERRKSYLAGLLGRAGGTATSLVVETLGF